MMKALTLSVTLLAVLGHGGLQPVSTPSSAANELCREPEGYAQAVEGPRLTGSGRPAVAGHAHRPARSGPVNTPEPPARRKGDGCLDEPPSYTVTKAKEPQA